MGLACSFIAFGVFVLPFLIGAYEMHLSHVREMERIRRDGD
jgi:hypothetical protein